VKVLTPELLRFIEDEPLATTLCYWTCEAHPWLQWPHEECAGPGMPVGASLRLLQEALGAV
jgi:hypothetical protein